MIGALADNGGPTQTHALLAASPAINAGDPAAPGSGGTACAAIDQRGYPRPQATACDIGAFERIRGFSVSGVLPNHGGNAGTVMAGISGSGFATGAAVKLSRVGQPDVPGTTVTVEDGGAAMEMSFDLNGAATGTWDVVVTNADATSIRLPAGFTIEPAQAPQLWSEIVGPPQRFGLSATSRYNILYGNRGNVDAVGVPLAIFVPGNFSFAVFSSSLLRRPSRVNSPRTGAWCRPMSCRPRRPATLMSCCCCR